MSRVVLERARAGFQSVSTWKGPIFEFDGDGGFDEPLEEPAEASSMLPPPPRPVATGVAARGRATCIMCCFKPCKAKEVTCADCSKDVAAARKDAANSGNLHFFDEQRKNDVSFRHMIRKYQESSPSKGSGAKRDAFAWSRLVESVFTESKSYSDNQGEWLDYFGFVAFQVYSRMKTAEQADELWKVELMKPDVIKDMNGKEVGFPDRILWKTHDIAGIWSAGGTRQETQRGTKEVIGSVELVDHMAASVCTLRRKTAAVEWRASLTLMSEAASGAGVRAHSVSMHVII